MAPSLVLLVVALGCGDPASSPDAGGATPDAASDATPPLDACGATAGVIDGPAGSFEGTLELGDGEDFNVAMGECFNEVSYYDEAGADEVVVITGLTAGTVYRATVTSAADLAIYVATGCDATGPAAGACLGFTDLAGPGVADVTVFEAPASGVVYAIVDIFNSAQLGAGTYTLTIDTPECLATSDCTEGTCVNHACVDCQTSFDCDAAEPLCTTAGCAVGASLCTDDDAAEAGSSDDGPAGATVLAVPDATTPTIVTAAICSLPPTPLREEDWYTFTTVAPIALAVAATWADLGTDIDLFVTDATGTNVVAGVGVAPGSEPVVTPVLPVGTYHVRLYKYGPAGVAAATPYTLTLRVPECTTSFDCNDAAAPVCAAARCVAGPAGCTGDDAGDTAGSDDGPAGAGVLASGVAVDASSCNASPAEADFHAVDVPQSGTLTASLGWAGSADLDLIVYDDAGVVLGGSLHVTPEQVALDFLRAGRYYLRVTRTGAAAAAVDAYTLTATFGAGAACATSTDCAATYATQIYRGVCTGGACEAIAAGERAAGAACDTGDDCASDACSYVLFEADAAESVCTTACTTTADCAAVGSGLTCSAGALTICMPSCASDLDCGANTGSAAIDPGQPWDYGACNLTSGVCTF